MTSQMTDEKLESITVALERLARTVEEMATAIRFLYEMKIDERERTMAQQDVTVLRQQRVPYPARNRLDYRDFIPKPPSTDPKD